MKRIYTASHHSFIDVGRADDSLYGAMVLIDFQHPEASVRQRFTLSTSAARELMETLESALLWLEPVHIAPPTIEDKT